jgi:hypothetical protein
MRFLPCPDISKVLVGVPPEDMKVLQVVYERGWEDALIAAEVATSTVVVAKEGV